MRNHDNKPALRRGGRYVVLRIPDRIPRSAQRFLLILGLIAGTNAFTHYWWNPGMDPLEFSAAVAKPNASLYLLAEASLHVPNPAGFEAKIRDLAGSLDIPPEWLMAVIYAESKFDPGIHNLQGSGAVGLIQFMPSTAQELNVSLDRLERMEAVQQLEYVYLYLQKVRERYGEYHSLTDLYLGVLYPKARGQDYCYTLFARPSTSYQQNRGLDENGDGRITVSDIETHLKQLFPEVYTLEIR